MTTETILTDEQIQCIGLEMPSMPMKGSLIVFARAIEQAVLQSPEVQQALQDKARIDWIESCFGADITRLGSGSWECDTGGFYGYAEAPSGMRVAIDAAMEKKE